MISQARSILGPPETTSGARSTLGPRAAHREWATNILATYSVLLDRTRGWAGRCCFLGGPGAPALQGRCWVLPYGSSHGSRPLHPQLGTRPTPSTGMTSEPFLPTVVTPAHRTHHGAEHRCWTRRPGATVTVADLPSPPHPAAGNLSTL